MLARQTGLLDGSLPSKLADIPGDPGLMMNARNRANNNREIPKCQ